MKNKTLLKKESSNIYKNFFDKRIDRFLEKELDKRSKAHCLQKNSHFAVFAHDYIASQINIYGVFEKDELDLLFSFLEPVKNKIEQGLALDIGANIGNHTVYFSNFFSKVYCYEPNPDVFEILRFNIRKKTSVTAFSIGLANCTSDAFINENNSNIGASSILRDQSISEGVIKVNLEKLDDQFFNENDIISFIKIDVEGFEFDVLSGGSNTIINHQPIIVFEQLKSEFKDGSTPSIQFLKDLGYKICWIEKDTERFDGSIRKEFYKFYKFFTKRDIKKIVIGDYVKHKSHSMLIALPERLHDQYSI